ncbi:uncharacterized protein LOC108040326 isoform X2 [Drosophila rhopaloa]|uniref:Uncharacterized protein LOC108040326 isoform X2 n=1 Tax=Drosophila rhopaloa TaxID=1041015 RepID=A0A6P4E5G0_DRORH|nr:uncharacterized protein LOC108040326 isoform X2 [Drosophila rhopaloa]
MPIAPKSHHPAPVRFITTGTVRSFAPADEVSIVSLDLFFAACSSLGRPGLQFIYTPILGFRVVASSSTAVKQDYNEYMWTMRKEFDEPEPLETESVVRENLSNIGREAASLGNYHKVDSPE